MKNIGIGMIGCGTMGRKVVRDLLALDGGLQVRGICDPEPKSVQNMLEDLPSPPHVYDDYRELVMSSDIDWVMIASWNCYHKEHVLAAFEAGKHVFCQKPLAVDFEACRAMYDSWKKSGKMFNIGFTLRYSPHYRKIKELLDGGAVGNIISMEFNETLGFNHGGYIMGNWRRLKKNAGTQLLEKCCHDIDLVNWMVGSLARRVASFGGLNFFIPENVHHMERLGNAPDGGKPAYLAWPERLVAMNPFTTDKDIVDNQVIIIEYANNVRAAFHINCNAAIPERRMYILGTEGAIRADVLTGAVEVKRIGFDTPLSDESTSAHGGHGGGDNVLAEELSRSMLKGTPPTVGLEEGVKSAVTCFAIDDAMDTGRVVDVTPYWEKIGLMPAKTK